MKPHLMRAILVALATTSIIAVERTASADTWIYLNQGKVDLGGVGVIYSYVHENVPAGTAITIETANLANSAATLDYPDTVVHVFDRDTHEPVASNDDCGGLNSCLTLAADSAIRSYVVYVHAYSGRTHGTAELRISHNGTPQVDTEPFSFGGTRVYVDTDYPADTLVFTTGGSPAPLGTRLLALNYTTSVLALDDNDGGSGFSNIHLPASLGVGGSFVVGANGGLVSGGPPDTAGVSFHWDSNLNYMMPYQKTVEDTAYEILREAAQAPDGRWFTAFAQAFDGRIGWYQANDLKDLILNGERYPVDLEFVAPSVLVGSQGQALGAYADNKIFLSTALTDAFTAGNVFVEEIAHHFDHAIGGPGDAPGDEGHIFWSYIVGDGLTTTELSDLKATDDHGTINVNGQYYSVEFLGLPTWVKKFFGTVWSGIKTTGGWVWSGATTAGSAIQTAASYSWNGASVLGGWIADGASIAADKTVEGLKRVGASGVYQIRDAVDSVHDLGLGIYDGAKIMKEGAADIGRGNFKDGVAALFVGLAKLSVEAPVSTFTGELVGALENIQVLLFLEPIGRIYTPEERAVIDWVFWNNDGWWAWRVRIKEGFCGLWSLSSRPFTLKSDIYLKKAAYGATPAQKMAMVVHESTHVWQWWNGGSTYILDSLFYQGLYYAGWGQYAYVWKPSVDSGTQWPGLTAEQQAAFVEAAYQTGCYAFSGCTIGTSNYDTYFSNSDYNIINGWGAP